MPRSIPSLIKTVKEKKKMNIRSAVQRRRMKRAERLSKRCFRTCSWKCSSASRLENFGHDFVDAVLEKFVYDFVDACWQETRTWPNQPLVHSCYWKRKDEQEEQMLKQSIFATLCRGLLYIINHRKSPVNFMPLYNIMIAQVTAFP